MQKLQNNNKNIRQNGLLYAWGGRGMRQTRTQRVNNWTIRNLNTDKWRGRKEKHISLVWFGCMWTLQFYACIDALNRIHVLYATFIKLILSICIQFKQAKHKESELLKGFSVKCIKFPFIPSCVIQSFFCLWTRLFTPFDSASDKEGVTLMERKQKLSHFISDVESHTRKAGWKSHFIRKKQFCEMQC